MEIDKIAKKPIRINKRIVIAWYYRRWNISLVWQLPEFLDLWLEEKEYRELVYHPDSAIYQLKSLFIMMTMTISFTLSDKLIFCSNPSTAMHDGKIPIMQNKALNPT